MTTAVAEGSSRVFFREALPPFSIEKAGREFVLEVDVRGPRDNYIIRWIIEPEKGDKITLNTNEATLKIDSLTGAHAGLYKVQILDAKTNELIAHSATKLTVLDSK